MGNPLRQWFTTRHAGASLALGALLLLPRLAAAQYTLTFDNPEPTGANHVLIAGTYGYPTTPGIVTITDGYASGFGTTTPISTGCSGGNSGLCFDNATIAAPASGQYAEFFGAGTHSGVGEFTFTPGGGRETDFVSVVLGNSGGAANSAEIRLYALVGGALVATYTNASLPKKSATTVTISGFTFAPGKTSTDLAGGYRFEWGTSGAGTNGDQLYVDNLIFKSELAPEPSVMVLLATGLSLLGFLQIAVKRRWS